jgi:hypothetical protein
MLMLVSIDFIWIYEQLACCEYYGSPTETFRIILPGRGSSVFDFKCLFDSFQKDIAGLLLD